MAKAKPIFIVAQWQHNSKGLYTLVEVGAATKYEMKKGDQRWTLRIGKSMYRLYPYADWQKHKKRGLPRTKIVPLQGTLSPASSTASASSSGLMPDAFSRGKRTSRLRIGKHSL